MTETSISSVAIIVLNYNNYKDTYQCLQSIKDVYRDNIGTYLIDNASEDESGYKLKEDFPFVNYYHLENNLGYAGGNNFGLKKAYEEGYEYFLVLNNDIVFHEDAITPLAKKLDENSQIGMVTCKVLYRDKPGIINSAGGKFSKLRCGNLDLGIGDEDNNIFEEKFVDFVPGMMFLLRKNVLEQVGYMREYFFLYFEDLEYSLRVNKKFKLLYTSEVSVYHGSGGGVKGKTYSAIYLYYHTRNRLWFFKTEYPSFYWYAIIFTLLNSIIKSVLTLLDTQKTKSFENSKINKLTKLWKGYVDGLFLKPQ